MAKLDPQICKIQAKGGSGAAKKLEEPVSQTVSKLQKS